MKYLFLVLLSLFFLNSFAITPSSKNDSEHDTKVDLLTEDLNNTKKELLEKTVNAYQLTNDRLNNYLTFTGIIATIFGVIIACGGIVIGFESLKSQKRRDEAIKILEEAKSYVEDKKSDFNLLIEKKIDELEKDYKKIIEIAKDRLFQDINNETAIVKELAEKKTQEIAEFSIQEERSETLEKLQKRIEVFENIGIPDDPKILLSKAKILREKEMYNEAIELLVKVKNTEPENWEAYWELGYNYHKLNNYDPAVESYKKSLEFNNNASSHNNLGVLYENAGKLYDALQEFEAALIFVKNKLYYRNKAKILVKLNSTEPAIDTYKELIEFDKADFISYQNLIKFFEKLNRNEEALEYYDLAILNIPDRTSQLNYLKGEFLVKIDKKAEALTLLQNLLPLNYKTEDCLELIAQIHLERNEKSEALKVLNSISELNIKNPFPYIKKAEIIVEENPTEAMKIIDEGLKNINTFGYLLHSSRIFLKYKHNDFAKNLQIKAVDVLKESHTNQEVDIMNLYEAYITIDNYDLARKIISDNRKYIKSPRYQLLEEFLTTCIKVLEKADFDIKIEIEKFKYLKSKSQESINWSFDDMKYYLNSKSGDYKFIFLLIDYIEDKITFEDFQKSL